MDKTSSYNQYNIKLNIFEGPLDLLLHLIKRAKIDIYDIPLALITDQYLNYIRMMQELNLDVAGDFLLMASYLMYIKSKSLLNANLDKEEDEELEDSKRLLSQRLIEYKTFKKGAEVLSSYEEERNKTISSPCCPIHQSEDIIEVDLFDLLKTYYTIIREKTSPSPGHRVTIDPIVIEEEMFRIISILRVKKRIFFRLLLKNLDRDHIIINFLALLELVKTQQARILQSSHFGEIAIQACL